MANPGKPSFVIAGAQRCGTTSLHSLCDEHPQIYMAKPRTPEPKYFLRDPTDPTGKDEYLRHWFADIGDAEVAGEKSTSYMETPGTANRMKAQFPDLKVVFILRHPVERAISNYRFSRRNGFEFLPLEEAIRHEPVRLAKESHTHVSVSPFAYLHRGRYFDQLKQFFRHFSDAELKILLHDDLENRPYILCRDIYTFLGVDPDFAPKGLGSRENRSEADDLRLTESLLDIMIGSFELSNRRLERYLGRSLAAWSRPTPMLERLVVV